jgi:hypothetical protein
MSAVVALVSAQPDADLVRYLQTVGFGVTAFRTPYDAPREGTLVWLVAPVSDDLTIIETVHVWLGNKQRLRAVVVSDRPARLRIVSERSPGRVVLLPAPVFGWQLVDALRNTARL